MMALPHGGRPSSVTPDKLAAAAAMRQQNRPMHAIAAALGVSRATLYRHLSADQPADPATGRFQTTDRLDSPVAAP